MHAFFGLRDQLPLLAFDPLTDASKASLPALQEYLDFYRLSFSKSICYQHVIGTFKAAGYELVAQYWLPIDPKPRGTVFFLHGYYDHVGLFSKLIEFLLQQGLVVVAYDQPGHGLSSGEQASINDFAEYVQVLQRCLQLANRFPQPWFGVAQSTGCAVYLHALMKERIDNPFKRMILLAPLIRPARWGRAIWRYRLISPFVSKAVRDIYQNSHDPDFVKFIQHQDPLQSKFLKIAWVGAMKKWLERFPFLDAIPGDILVLQGEEDETVDWRYNLALLQRKLRDARYYRLPKAAHHLANEEEELRQQVFGQIKQFLLAS